MNAPTPKMTWVVWGALGLIILSVAAFSFIHPPAAASDKPMPVIGQIPDFHLTNQDNSVVSLADLRGKVWVADLIFTRCPTMCPAMTRRFAQLQAELAPYPDVRLVSFTSDPTNDTPAVLKKYAGDNGAVSTRWWFLTGQPKEIHDLEVNDFKFVALEKKPEERSVPDDWFSHSTWFALVDRQGRVRGWFDKEGREHAVFESEDADALAALRAAVKQLLREPAT